MILKYVLKNFSRRKVRTILMILSLLVSTGLIVTMSATVETVRRSNVDLIASAVGRYDLAVTKTDTSLDPFINIDEVSPQILSADPNITGVYPRMIANVELNVNGTIGEGTMIGLDQETDNIGYIDVVSGTYQLGGGNIALLEDTAFSYGLGVGDTLVASYSFPSPRERGEEAVVGASERRTTESFTIASIVRQDGVAGGGVREGFIIDLQDVQNWLNLPDKSQSLIATVKPSLYESSNAEAAALEVRDVVRAVQQQLGDDYNYSLDKAATLSEAAQAFLILQALINTYGVMALGVVGLLVHTLVMTNVQEQRRDMAILRILGSQRNFLFTLVITEVITIGIIGVAFGVVLGQLITRFIVVPLIQAQMATEGITSPLVPQISISTLLPVILASFIVLILSSLKPAQEAARTKVMHAINPGVADNIQLEDLARLRERRPDFKLFLGGLALMLIFALIAGFQVVDTFGGPALEVMFVLLALGLMVLGLGLMFFITTVPFERIVLFVMGLVVPRLTYFARRNVGRGQSRNTLISLLVLFSGVLPSFLATQTAMENANFEATVRQSIGAPADIQVTGFFQTPEEQERNRLNTQFRTQDLAAVPGVDQTVGLTYGFSASVADTVGFRGANFTVYGVDGFLNNVLFTDLMEFVGGGPEALDALLDDPQAIIISEGLADYLAVTTGDTIKVQGEGTDHVVNAHIIAIARQIPSLGGISRSRSSAEFGSDALMSLDGFRELITPLDQPLPAPDAHLLQRIAITLAPDASAATVVDDIANRFRGEHPLRIRSLEVSIEENQRSQAIQQIFLLVLTIISFTTAVFGVFAVIYVTIYSRRLEIGMMKAIGMRRRELTGMLIVESITMTLGAALAGIAAGATMGYISFYGERALSQRPATFAFDSTVIPFIVIMVTLASILGAAFSARRIVTKRAVEILRM
ncbi:MAG: FtsX-like permease family protein [Candidatus Promineifilaceae bacterium]